MLVNSYSVSPTGMTKVLELLFDAANGAAIIDSTGRHSPSLSPSGTRQIVSNKLSLNSGGFVRADAQNTASSDFDFSTGDWSVECDAIFASNSHIIWNKKASDSAGYGLVLRMNGGSNTRIVFQNSSGTNLLDYTSPTSLINTQLNLKVERIAGRLALHINDVEVVSSTTALGSIDSSGMIIGNSANGFAATIDNFVVMKSGI